MRLLIQVHFELGQMQNFAGKTDEARKHIATALHFARPYQAAAPSDDDRRQFLGGTLAGFADLQFDSRQVREALANYREALAMLDSAEFRGRLPATLQMVRTIHDSIGLALTETGRYRPRSKRFVRQRKFVRGWFENTRNLRYPRTLLISDLNSYVDPRRKN